MISDVLLNNFINLLNQQPINVIVPALCAKLTTCVDPFIYTLNQPKVRNDISLRFRAFFPSSDVDFSAGVAAAPYYNNIFPLHHADD